MSAEYRVVWRWREADYRGAVYPERQRLYGTERGARRLLDKLQSNGGVYERWDEHDAHDGSGFVMTKLALDYARLESREVGDWQPFERGREAV